MKQNTRIPLVNCYLPREARTARRVLDNLLPQGDLVFRKSPWGNGRGR